MTSEVLTPEGDLYPPRPVAPPRRWRRWFVAALRGPFEGAAWRALGYHLFGLPLAGVGFTLVLSTIFLGAGLAVTFLGLPIVAVAGIATVRLGGAQQRLARSMLDRDIPVAIVRPPLPGFLGWLQSRLVDPVVWRARLYWLVHLPLTMASLYAIAICWFEGLIGIIYPALWKLSGPVSDAEYRRSGLPGLGGGPPPQTTEIPHRYTFHIGSVFLDTWPRALAAVAVGILLLLVVPWLTRGLARLDVALGRRLLGPTRRSRRIERLEAARGVMADDAAATLRRIERDLHDGAQAQLVALAMNLGELKERVEAGGGTDRALAELVTTTHTRAKEALVELRSITGGIHPPALDLGLDHALATLAARSVVPTTLEADLPSRPSDAVATIAYYSVAELLTNVAKHSGARLATVTVTEAGERLVIGVCDDGRGGADPAGGTGLAGLAARLSAVDGSLDLDSPAGGPTVVTVELPLRI